MHRKTSEEITTTVFIRLQSLPVRCKILCGNFLLKIPMEDITICKLFWSKNCGGGLLNSILIHQLLTG